MAILSIQIKQYLKTYHIINYETHKEVQVSFIPDENIYCDPPYIQGKMDSAWIKIRYDEILDTTNQKQCEKLLGMKLQEIS